MKLINMIEILYVVPDLQLSVSMRSFRAEMVSTFVHHLLELRQTEAAETLKEQTYSYLKGIGAPEKYKDST